MAVERIDLALAVVTVGRPLDVNDVEGEECEVDRLRGEKQCPDGCGRGHWFGCDAEREVS